MAGLARSGGALSFTVGSGRGVASGAGRLIGGVDVIGAGGGVATAGGSGGVTGSDRLGGASFDPERADHVAIPARAITTSATPATRCRGDQIDAGIASRSSRIPLTIPAQR
jgi:hypothetical protein